MKHLFLSLGLLGIAGGPLEAEPVRWAVDPADSSISWTAKWNTSPVQGGFQAFAADIRFDPNALEQSKVVVRVDIGSIFMKGQDAHATLVNDDWFDAADHPQALFETTSFRHIGNGRYEADASLRIKGVTRQVVLPFKLTIEGALARMEGSLVLDRKTFAIGGEDGIAAAVAPDVALAVIVTARRD